ncbi:MAG: hypothetical protein K1X55_13555 [Chitinophagales bacterium]|nr:hypothetical protein [Chitinophagales bacterium]
MSRYLSIIAIIVFAQLGFGQTMDDCFVPKDFLIIGSYKSYDDALKRAREAELKFNIALNLRDLLPTSDTSIGLTLPVDSCLQMLGEGNTTCYWARGRWDDGIYVSIEYSNAYTNFARGYYFVVIGSGSKDDPILKSQLKKTKKVYKDAYIKTSKVYLCCMH